MFGAGVVDRPSHRSTILNAALLAYTFTRGNHARVLRRVPSESYVFTTKITG